MTAVADSREAAARALAFVPDMGDARVLHQLAAGPTNMTWLIEQGGQRWVLRQDRPAAAALGLDRESERQVSTVAAAAGLTPAYRYFDPSSGVSLRPFVTGRSCTREDLRDRDRLGRLALLLRRLHGLPAAGRPFDPAAAARRYAERIGTRESAELALRATAAWKIAQGPGGPPVPCHNDLVAENVLETPDGELLLIDWEYAGMGDPFFDLAIVVCHHDLDDSLARSLLEAYLRRMAVPAEIERLQRQSRFYGLLLQLWEQVV